MAGMTDQDFAAWLAQHGGEVGRKDNEDEIDDPSGALDAAGHPKKVKSIVGTTVTAKDGATLTLRRSNGWSVDPSVAPYEVVENTGPKTTATAQKPTNVYIGTNPATGKPTQVSEYPDGHKEYDDTQVPAAQAGSAAPPTTKDEGGRRFQWEPNPGGTAAGGKWVDVGPAPLTTAEQAQQPSSAEVPVTGRPGWVQITTKTGNTTRTQFRGPDGTVVDTLPAETKSDRKPVEGQPGVYLVSTTNGTKTETHFENEAGQTIQAPSSLPTTIVSNGVTYVRGADNTYAPAQGIPNPNTPIPAGVQPFTPDPSQEDYGLSARNDYLHELERQGVITKQQGDQIIKEDGDHVTLVAGRRTQAQAQANTERVGDISQRTQDLGDIQSRRTTGTGYLENLLTGFRTEPRGMTGEEGLAAKAFLAALNLGPINASAWGGMAQVPQVDSATLAAAGAPNPSIVVHPTGHVEIPMAPAPAAQPAAPSGPLLAPPPAIPGQAPVPQFTDPNTGQFAIPGSFSTGPTQPTAAAPAAPLASPLQAPGAGPTVKVRDQWGNEYDMTQQQIDSRPANSPALTPVSIAPNDPARMALQAPVPPWQPDIQALKARGFDDATIQQAIIEHQQEMGAA